MSIPAATPASTTPSAGGAQPRVPHNRWDEIQVPTIGAWTPTKSVSVVVPAFNDHEELPRTLAALGAQSYPAELMEIVVVDDGSEPALDVPDRAGAVPVRVIRQSNEGFGAGKARSTGGYAASGEVLLFIDADIVVDAAHVEAHARWHHVIDHAVTLGFRSFVEFSGVTADDVRDALAGDGLDAVLGEREQQEHEWIEKLLAETDHLRRPRGDLWRIAVGSSISVPAWLFREVGGFPVFGIRGTEDTTFGYRLFTQGAVFVPDREARSWHQGARYLSDENSKQAAMHARLPVMANHVPAPNYRKAKAGRSYTVPYLAIEVPVRADEVSEQQALACVESLLAGDTADAAIGLTGPPGDPVLARLALWTEGQERVEVTTPSEWWARHLFTPFRVTVPPHVHAGRGALNRIRERLAHHEIGALHIVIDGLDPRTRAVEAVSVRALRRAHRLADDPTQVPALVGELFDEEWATGEEFEFGTDPVPVTPVLRTGRYRGLGPEEITERLSSTEDALARLRRRRAVVISDAVGRLLRARSPRAIATALRGLGRAVLGRPAR